MLEVGVDISENLPSKSFCVLPFIHLFVSEYGEFYPCCHREPGVSALSKADEHLVQANNKNSLDSAYNSPELDSLRQKFLEGEFPDRCKQCWTLEKHNLSSSRTHFNKIYGSHINTVVEDFRESKLSSLKFLDIRLGNKCNFACRMCTPQFTKNLISEFSEFENKPEKYERENKLNWYESKNFWESMLDSSHNIDRINFAGGEPFLVREHFNFLRKLVDRGDAGKIVLTYMTNLSVLPPEIYHLWPYFKAVELSVSIDGVGKINEYIRSKSNWKKIDQNFKKIQLDWESLNITEFSIGSVVQIYNIFNLKDLYLYNFQNNNRARRTIYPTLVQGTDYLDIVHLPESIKETASKSLLDIKKAFDSKIVRFFMQQNSKVTSEMYDSNYDLICNQVDGIIEHMMNTPSNPSKLEEFVSYTKFLDQKRGENIVQLVPQLKDLFN